MTQSELELMFSRIIPRKDAFYKSQQRNEPDLTDEEKLNILRNLFETNSKLFLSRYYTYLSSDDARYFNNSNNDYDVSFYLNEIRKYGASTSKTSKDAPQNVSTPVENSIADELIPRRRTSSSCKPKSNSASVRNRRYAALRKLVKEGEFFSDTEMKVREPLLYEQMVGQYLSPEELEEIFQCGSHSTKTMSEMFMAFADNQRAAEVRENEELLEEAYKMTIHGNENNDSDGSESEMEEEEEEDENQKPPVERITVEEKLRLREEFLAVMHERFLEGKDGDHFNYADVDFNPEYDPMDLISQDAEDSYFDSEEPS